MLRLEKIIQNNENKDHPLFITQKNGPERQRKLTQGDEIYRSNHITYIIL